MIKKTIYACAFALAVVAVMPSCGSSDKKGDSTSQQEEVNLNRDEVTVDDEAESDEKDNGFSDEAVSAVDDENVSAVTEGNASSSSSSSDIDEFLNDYDQYMTKAIALYKKVAAGDYNATLEYASLYSDVVSLSEKLENMKGEMTTAQLARFNKILAKQVNSLSAM
ncbi:MAG: hypothetical protein NC402_07700 [Prevotella sp.]|nr:hypothetical protein [Prevotella sp.]MCM1074069.1 hypothetical protein [Ruminococcus sp.]